MKRLLRMEYEGGVYHVINREHGTTATRRRRWAVGTPHANLVEGPRFAKAALLQPISKVTALKAVFLMGSTLLPIMADSTQASEVVHVWEQVEITLQADVIPPNPYTDAKVWVQLHGPGIDKRIDGFWDGGRTFRVRVMGTAPGTWSWTSHAEPVDAGLDRREGGFIALERTEAERLENPNRRGIIRPTANGRALEYADGTPFFLLADTHWSAGTWRYPLEKASPSTPVPPGPEMGFESFLRFLGAAGYNSIGMISCFPSWDTDAFPSRLSDDSGVEIRSAWSKPGDAKRAADMHDDEGNRSFRLPGRTDGNEEAWADFDQIDPAYW